MKQSTLLVCSSLVICCRRAFSCGKASTYIRLWFLPILMLSTDDFITFSIMIPSPKLTVLPWKVIGTQKGKDRFPSTIFEGLRCFFGGVCIFHSNSRPLLTGPANGPVWVHFKTAFDCAPWFWRLRHQILDPTNHQFFRFPIGLVWKMMLSDLYCYKYWDVQDVQGER